MGRPPLHDADALLDVAVELLADGGPQAVTMTAVAKAAGAPSGSVYHRFPNRGSLLAAMWLRTTRQFEDGYRRLVDDPTPGAAVAAIVWFVDWCRVNPGPAAVLQAGARALESETWPKAWRDELAARDAARRRSTRELVRAVAVKADRPADEVAFAMFDLPLAIVRPHLIAGRRVPRAAVEHARRLASRLLLD